MQPGCEALDAQIDDAYQAAEVQRALEAAHLTDSERLALFASVVLGLGVRNIAPLIPSRTVKGGGGVKVPVSKSTAWNVLQSAKRKVAWALAGDGAPAVRQPRMYLP